MGVGKLPQDPYFFSADGVDDVGAYIRGGYTQEAFNRTMDVVRPFLPNVALDITLNSIGIIDLHNLIQFAVDQNIQVEIKSVFATGFRSYLDLSVVKLDVIRHQRMRVAGIIPDERCWKQRILDYLDRVIATHTARPFNSQDQYYTNLYEQQRGEVGFFESHTRGKLNS